MIHASGASRGNWGRAASTLQSHPLEGESHLSRKRKRVIHEGPLRGWRRLKRDPPKDETLLQAKLTGAMIRCELADSREYKAAVS